VAKTGAERIAAERRRQIEQEGWTAGHDDEHDEGELALVAALYATPIPLYRRTVKRLGSGTFCDPWPPTWDEHWDKRPREDGVLLEPSPSERIRMLEKAGALIAAEIDRLLRASPEPKNGGRP
jgi:hypothetical protein